jgi:hypothetical protein
MWSDRSVVLAIGWSRIAPLLGVSFPLAPGWEIDTGYFSRDNVVREKLGVATDREAADELLARIERNKAGTLVKLAITREFARAQKAQLEDGWLALAYAAIAAAIATQFQGFKILGRTVSIATVIETIRQGGVRQADRIIEATNQEINERIAKRSDRVGSETTNTDRPRAFGSKN